MGKFSEGLRITSDITSVEVTHTILTSLKSEKLTFFQKTSWHRLIVKINAYDSPVAHQDHYFQQAFVDFFAVLDFENPCSHSETPDNYLSFMLTKHKSQGKNLDALRWLRFKCIATRAILWSPGCNCHCQWLIDLNCNYRLI